MIRFFRLRWLLLLAVPLLLLVPLWLARRAQYEAENPALSVVDRKLRAAANEATLALVSGEITCGSQMRVRGRAALCAMAQALRCSDHIVVLKDVKAFARENGGTLLGLTFQKEVPGSGMVRTTAQGKALTLLYLRNASGAYVTFSDRWRDNMPVFVVHRRFAPRFEALMIRLAQTSRFDGDLNHPALIERDACVA